MSDAHTDEPTDEQDELEQSSRGSGGDAEAAGSIEEREDVAEELVDESDRDEDERG